MRFPWSRDARERSVVARKAKAPTAVVIQTELESGVNIYWRLSQDDLQQVDAPASGVVFSFSRADHRFAVTRSFTAERAKSYAVREAESDERMRVVNLSAKHRRIYAAPVSRLNTATHSIAPGMQVFDALTEARNLAPPLVTGLLATSKDGTQRLVILQAVSPNGHVEFSVSMNPEDVDQAVALFVSAVRLPEDCPKLIFSAQEFLHHASSAIAFPKEPEWQGISTRAIAVSLIVAATTAAAASAAFAGYHFVRARATERSVSVLLTQSRATQQRIGTLMASAPVAVASRKSLPMATILNRAERIWINGARVSIRADRNSTQYKITMPLTSPQNARSNATSALSDAHLNRINSVLELQPPSGCARRENTTTGLANEVQVAIDCQDYRSSLPL